MDGGLGGRRRRLEEGLVVFDLWKKYWRRRVEMKQKMKQRI